MEEAQKHLQVVAEFSPLDYAKQCPDLLTHGQGCGTCLRLETLDAALCTHLDEVNKLLKIRAEVKKHLNRHHDRVTRYLPAEITSHIFTLYTENFNLDFDPQNPIVKQGGPLVLGAVSRSWREIAFGTPRLWNTANILIPSTDNLPMKVELTKQWLDRSRCLPLYLSLFHSIRPDDQVEPEPNPLIPLFTVLQHTAPRWRELVLGISLSFYTIFLGELTSAPILDTLKLEDVHFFTNGVFRLPHTPSLKHLNLLGIHLSEISIEWDNLTTLESDFISMDGFFEVLRLMDQLNSFRLGCLLMDRGEYPLPTTPLTHLALRQLYLEASDSDIEATELETLLDLVVFPSLEKFGYRSSSESFFPNGALQSLFNRSHCPLTHFDLSGDLRDCTSDDFISILSDLPTITHLKLVDTYGRRPEDAIMSDEFLQRLTHTRRSEVTHNGRLLPRLQSLDFLGYKMFSWTCLASLVSARASDGGPERQGSAISIRSISFRVCSGEIKELIDAHSLAQFKVAQNAGVSIVILKEEPPHRSRLGLSFDTSGNSLYPLP